LQKDVTIRDLCRADLPFVASIVDATGMFPADMLEPMAEPYLAGHAPHRWLVAQSGEQVLGFAYAEPERMTDGTFNLLAIGVDPAHQDRGVGKALVRFLEAGLRTDGARVLIVETSSLAEFARARAFYAGQSFSEEACIRDFYAEAEHKILFWKRV
jgi:ribosomal protein S18 acetylase RimI-like enzyme